MPQHSAFVREKPGHHHRRIDGPLAESVLDGLSDRLDLGGADRFAVQFLPDLNYQVHLVLRLEHIWNLPQGHGDTETVRAREKISNYTVRLESMDAAGEPAFLLPSVPRCLCGHEFLETAPIRSVDEWSFGSPTIATVPPYARTMLRSGTVSVV